MAGVLEQDVLYNPMAQALDVQAKAGVSGQVGSLAASHLSVPRAQDASLSTVSVATKSMALNGDLSVQNNQARADGFLAQAVQADLVKQAVQPDRVGAQALTAQQTGLLVMQQQAAALAGPRNTESDVDKSRLTTESPLLLDAASKAARQSIASLVSISYPLNHQKWNEAMGKRLVFMANQNIQMAQISLNPEKMGPIQLRLHMDREQMVSVSMSAHHATTREALEAAIPRLKEMLAEAGIDFDQVNVQEDAVFDQARDSSSVNAEKAGAGGGEVLDNEQVVAQQSDNLIDFYA